MRELPSPPPPLSGTAIGNELICNGVGLGLGVGAAAGWIILGMIVSVLGASLGASLPFALSSLAVEDVVFLAASPLLFAGTGMGEDCSDGFGASL